MIFNRVFFFFYNFIGIRARQRLKLATSLPHGGGVGDDSSFWKRVKEFQTSDCLTLSSSVNALEGEICCVCLSSMDKGKNGIETTVLPCLHELHKVCVDRWFEERRKTCPICRFSMEQGEVHENGTQILTEEMAIWFSSFHTSGF